MNGSLSRARLAFTGFAAGIVCMLMGAALPIHSASAAEAATANPDAGKRFATVLRVRGEVVGESSVEVTAGELARLVVETPEPEPEPVVAPPPEKAKWNRHGIGVRGGLTVIPTWAVRGYVQSMTNALCRGDSLPSGNFAKGLSRVDGCNFYVGGEYIYRYTEHLDIVPAVAYHQIKAPDGLWLDDSETDPITGKPNIGALAQRVLAHWQTHGRGDKLVMSFHGVPERTRALGDPYYDECLASAKRLGERLSLRDEQLVVTFQSRFGKAAWLQPYTEPTLVALAKQGVASVDVMCPGFTADCLETLEEISMQNRDLFLGQGGEAFDYVPCLNSSAAHVDVMEDVVLQHAGGWPGLGTDRPDDAALAAQRERALARGAQR